MPKLTYNNKSFTQDDNSKLVNLTEMFRVFGDNLNYWLNKDYTKNICDSISESLRIEKKHKNHYPSEGDLLVHPIIALEAAKWIDLDFYIWCCQNFDLGLEKKQMTPTKSSDKPNLSIQALELAKVISQIQELLKDSQPDFGDKLIKLVVEDWLKNTIVAPQPFYELRIEEADRPD